MQVTVIVQCPRCLLAFEAKGKILWEGNLLTKSVQVIECPDCSKVFLGSVKDL